VPEPCGYVVLPLITIIQENRALRQMKKLHAPVGVPPSGLLGVLASLRLLVRGLLPATTRRTGEAEEGGKKGGRERGGREKQTLIKHYDDHNTNLRIRCQGALSMRSDANRDRSGVVCRCMAYIGAIEFCGASGVRT
jgi:hypothetical protein